MSGISKDLFPFGDERCSPQHNGDPFSKAPQLLCGLQGQGMTCVPDPQDLTQHLAFNRFLVTTCRTNEGLRGRQADTLEAFVEKLLKQVTK